MVVTKENAYNVLVNECKKLLKSDKDKTKSDINDKRKTRDEVIDGVVSEYNMEENKAVDLVTLRTGIENTTEFDIFCVLSIIDNDKLTSVFTQKEIKIYSKEKYCNDSVKFPIEFNAIEVESDQWLSVISMKDLMKLRDARLINYNENTQRTLRRIVRGDSEIFSIAVNYKQVNEIVRSFLDGAYIPNTITLNIPEDADFDYIGGKLTIKSLPHFDILDGYHRYLALSRINMMNPEFNCRMELRLACFSEEKAKQFIWQEDQKTKMKRIDSDLMNRNNNGNQIVTLLNDSGILAGKINTSDGIINAAIFARAINTVFFNGEKSVSRSKYIKIKNLITDYIRDMADADPSLLKNKWDMKYIVAFTVACSTGKQPEEMPECIEKLLKMETTSHKDVNLIAKSYLNGGI